MTRWLFSFLLYKILVNIIHCQLLRFYFCNTFSAAQVLYNHQHYFCFSIREYDDENMKTNSTRSRLVVLIFISN